uniref:RH1 domain-containing protein n=1 Tax=Meloidogyne enterolobii TaxID=390850 RepID=A0A6V7U0K7_MELEN|nr:unnamed protein product [Meloidogyne enterolobii]
MHLTTNYCAIVHCADAQCAIVLLCKWITVPVSKMSQQQRYTTTSSSILSSSPSKQLTVIDVYDLAESINRDFEILVEKYGNDSFESIVGKVISALETLEALAKYNDKDNCEIIDLQKTIQRFEQEKQQRIKDKEILERDFIELEESYKKEIDDLCKIIQKLQTENKCMKEQLSSGEDVKKEEEKTEDVVDETTPNTY